MGDLSISERFGIDDRRCAFCGKATPPLGCSWQTVTAADLRLVCSATCGAKLVARDMAQPAHENVPADAADEWPEIERLIAAECLALANMLVAKNRAYGNSALDPLRIFSKADPAEQIRVRIDDKLSRLARGQAAGEDVELDLMGYLVLLRVARKMGGAP